MNIGQNIEDISVEAKLRTDAMVYTKLVAVSIITFIIVILPLFISFPFVIPNRLYLSIILIIELISGICFEIFILNRIRRKLNYQQFTYYSIIIDIFMMALFLHFLSGISGELFFFYTLNIMGAAYTFRREFPFIAAGFGVFFIIFESVNLYLNFSFQLSLISILKPLMQIIYLLFMGYYGSVLSQKIVEERKKKEEAQKLNEALEMANKRLKELDEMKEGFTDIAIKELQAPVTAIKNYLWMLREGSGKQKVLGKKEKNLNKVIRQSEELLNSILTTEK